MASPEPTATPRLPPDTRTGRAYSARSVGALLPKITAPAFERYGFHSAEIMTSWPTIAGAEIARLTRPLAIRWPRGAKSRAESADEETRAGGATLVIACDPAFALDVSYRTQTIIERINRYFGYGAVAKLQVIQAPQNGVDSPKSKNVEAPQPAPATGDLSLALETLRQSIASATTPR